MNTNKYLNLFLNLKIIGKLKPHVRLNTSESVFRIYNSSYFIPIWIVRWFTSGNREHDVARIESVYKEAGEFVHNEENDEGERSQILTAMEQSIVGLHNIGTTYDSDVTIQSRIEVIICNTELLLRNMNDE